MKVLIVRNASLDNNASMKRVINALIEENQLQVISRNRFNSNKVDLREFDLFGKLLIDHEINLNAEMGSGKNNILNLVKYNLILFCQMYKMKKETDIIHSFDLDTGLSTYLFSKIFKKKYIYHIADFYIDSRGGIPGKLKGIVKKIEFKVINNADGTIICTEDRREQIKGANPKNLSIIHNTPLIENRVQKKNTLYKYGGNEFTLVYIGTLSKQRFIKELVKVVIDVPGIRLIIGGYGPLQSWVEEESLHHDSIQYLGRVPYEETFDYYQAADLIVAMYDPTLENHKYAAPNKIYEAMIFGKPILVAKGSGIEKLVEEKDMGFVIEYNYLIFKELISKIKDDKNLLVVKSENSFIQYENYSWLEMKERIRDLYNKI